MHSSPCSTPPQRALRISSLPLCHYPHYLCTNLYRERSRAAKGKRKSKKLQIEFEGVRKEEEKQEEKEHFAASNCTDHPSTVKGSRAPTHDSTSPPCRSQFSRGPKRLCSCPRKITGQGVFSGRDLCLLRFSAMGTSTGDANFILCRMSHLWSGAYAAASGQTIHLTGSQSPL